MKRGLAILLILTAFAAASAKADNIRNHQPGQVTVFPISREALDKYQYNPNEYWISGTDVVGEFSIENASRFYSELFDAIRDNFIEPVAPGFLVDKVLESLSGFMERLDITVAGERVMIYDGNLRLVGNFRKPADTDSRAWANLIVNVILNLRDNVPEIRRAHPEQIYHLTAIYLLKSLDGNARYLDPLSAQREREAHHSTSLGFDWRRIPAGLQVLGIGAGMPVAFSGIREGDVITHINVAETSKLSDEAVIDALWGNDFGIVHLGFVSYMTRQYNEVYIRRNATAMPFVTVTNAESRTPSIIIHNFGTGSARALRVAIEGLDRSKITGIVIDVRGNMGGEFSEAIESANLLIPGGNILTTRGRSESSNNLYTAKTGDIMSGKPIVILADMTTRGPAEVFAFAMEAGKRTVLAGSPTYGIGTVSERFDFSSGQAMHFATSRIYSPGGVALDKMGAFPLVCIATFKTERDIDTFARNARSGRFRDERQSLASPTDTDVDAARQACPATYPTAEAQAMALRIAEAIILGEGVYEALARM